MKKVLIAVCICFTFMLFVSSSALAQKDIPITGNLLITGMTVYAGVGVPCDVIGTLTPDADSPGFGQVFPGLEMTASGDALNLALLSEYNIGSPVVVDVLVLNLVPLDVIILSMTVPAP